MGSIQVDGISSVTPALSSGLEAAAGQTHSAPRSRDLGALCLGEIGGCAGEQGLPRAPASPHHDLQGVAVVVQQRRQ
jgi:hypothetical protein